MNQAEKLWSLRENAYRYIADDGSEDEKTKYTKQCVIKRKLKFKN